MHLVDTKHVKVNCHLKCLEKTALYFPSAYTQVIVYAESTGTEQRAMDLILVRQVFQSNDKVF